jgi:hypothetical protein
MPSKAQPKAEPKTQPKTEPQKPKETAVEPAPTKSENRKPSDRMVRIKNVTRRNLFVEGNAIAPGAEADIPVRAFLNFGDRARKA